MTATKRQRRDLAEHPLDVDFERERLAASEAMFCALHGARLEPAEDYGWLVRLVDSGEPGVVVGCIDIDSGRFELMQLTGGFRWMAFDSLHAALAHLFREQESITAA